MKKAEFGQDLITGNDVIDAQHKALIDTANALVEAIENKVGFDAAHGVLNFLNQYTTFHFGGEEKFMQEKKYPQYEEHKALHDAFGKTVQRLYSDYMLGGRSNFPVLERIQNEVTNWLVNHIQGEDKKMIAWVNENP